MVKIFIVILMLSISIVEAPRAMAQNPFTAKGSPQRISSVPPLPSPFLGQITAWQHLLKQKMTTLSRKAKKTGSLRPLFSLILIAFVYGVVHAAGPGHGKALAASYLVCYGARIWSGVIVGNLIALLHGLSGVGLVLAVHFVLNLGISGPLESVTRTTQLVSYSLITLLGLGLLVRSLILWRRYKTSETSHASNSSKKAHRYSVAVAFTVGIVPCPGVVLVMLFCLSLNLLGLGLLLAFSLSLGMAVTISTVGVAVLAGKGLALGTLDRRGRFVMAAERAIEIVAAIMVTSLGLLLFAATLNTS